MPKIKRVQKPDIDKKNAKDIGLKYKHLFAKELNTSDGDSDIEGGTLESQATKKTCQKQPETRQKHPQHEPWTWIVKQKQQRNANVLAAQAGSLQKSPTNARIPQETNHTKDKKVIVP